MKDCEMTWPQWLMMMVCLSFITLCFLVSVALMIKIDKQNENRPNERKSNTGKQKWTIPWSRN